MTDLQMLGNSFANLTWYRRTKDLVPLFDPKEHLFENSLLKILAQLQGERSFGKFRFGGDILLDIFRTLFKNAQ